MQTLHNSENLLFADFHSSLVLLNETGYHFQVGVQGADGSLFILAHEAAVTLDIGTQDGCELALKLFCSHGIISLRGYEGNEGCDCSGNLGFGFVYDPVQG